MSKTKRQPSKTRRKVGRPAKFACAKDLEMAVNKYFISIKRPRRAPTLAALSSYLDFADYSTFKDYEAKAEFSHVLKKAKMRIIAAHEENLFSRSCTGSIFWLKCHGGDMFRENPQQHEHSGPGGGPLGFEIEWGEPDDGDGSG